MAKPSSIKIRLNSTADTAFFNFLKKNNKTITKKAVKTRKTRKTKRVARKVTRRIGKKRSRREARFLRERLKS